MNLLVTDLVPHHGAMCLLDSVENWDERAIVCRATSHWRPDHPLKHGSKLRALCAIEYGAQAVAAHASLLTGPDSIKNRSGFLASVRDVIIHVPCLDDLEHPLVVRAELVLARGDGRIYEVVVTAGQSAVLTGRIIVMVSSAVAVDIS